MSDESAEGETVRTEPDLDGGTAGTSVGRVKRAKIMRKMQRLKRADDYVSTCLTGETRRKKAQRPCAEWKS